jgi:hypothetical protein
MSLTPEMMPAWELLPIVKEQAARIEQLEAYALKAFTVVEFCAGEGLLLPHPHFDCDDLLMEGVDLLKVETSEEARAALDYRKMEDVHSIGHEGGLCPRERT